MYLENFDSLVLMPLQSMQIQLIKVNDNSTLIIYKHIVLDYIPYNALKSNSANKQKILKKIKKMVKTIIKTEEDGFLLESYEDLKNDLNKRLNTIIKKQEKIKEKNNFNDLFSSSSSQKNDIGNMENLNYLDDENQSLKHTIKMSSEINSSLKDTNNELDNQSKKLNESNEKVVKTLQKMPIIGKMLGEVKYYKIREKLIIGCVVGIALIFGLYIIFYRKNK